MPSDYHFRLLMLARRFVITLDAVADCRRRAARMPCDVDVAYFALTLPLISSRLPLLRLIGVFATMLYAIFDCR